MKRRAFIKALGAGFVVLASTNPLSAFSVFKEKNDYGDQLKLIDDIKKYAKANLNMQLGNYFYTDWEKKEGMLHYLYVSESNKVKVPIGLNDFQYFGTKMRAAYAAAKNYQKKGYHTLVYKTAGTSATLLNKPLMSYPLESIAIIVFHEALHVHIRQKERSIPLSIEEAAGDVLANEVTFMYQKKNPVLDKKILKTLVKVNEKIYHSINTNLTKLEKDKPKDKVYRRCRIQINKALRKGNHYQRNRFNYSVNNAFFVRNSFYSQYYFLLKKVYHTFKDPKGFIEFVAGLPSNIDAALQKIHERI